MDAVVLGVGVASAAADGVASSGEVTAPEPALEIEVTTNPS